MQKCAGESPALGRTARGSALIQQRAPSRAVTGRVGRSSGLPYGYARTWPNHTPAQQTLAHQHHLAHWPSIRWHAGLARVAEAELTRLMSRKCCSQDNAAWDASSVA